MNIQPISNNISMQAKPPKPNGTNKPSIINRVKQTVLDMFSPATFKDNTPELEKMQRRDANLSHPAINRAVMGGTAIVLQPIIDWFNKSVDEDTRRISVCRTLAKIIAGTTVGIIVRGSCHKIVEKMTDLTSKSKYSKALIPNKNWLRVFVKYPERLKIYRSALSTGAAIIAMCFTNFAFDAPFTVKLTNKFKGISENLKQKAEAKKEQQKVEVAYG